MSNTTNPCAGTGQPGSFAYGTPNGHVVCPACGRIVKAYPGGKVRSHKPADQPVAVDAHHIVIQTWAEDAQGRLGFQPVCDCRWTGAVLRTRAGGVKPSVRAERWGARHVADMQALASLQAEHAPLAVSA